MLILTSCARDAVQRAVGAGGGEGTQRGLKYGTGVRVAVDVGLVDGTTTTAAAAAKCHAYRR